MLSSNYEIDTRSLGIIAAFETNLLHLTTKQEIHSPPPKLRIEPHPKSLSKHTENAWLATHFNHLWGGLHNPTSPGPSNLRL